MALLDALFGATSLRFEDGGFLPWLWRFIYGPLCLGVSIAGLSSLLALSDAAVASYALTVLELASTTASIALAVDCARLPEPPHLVIYLKTVDGILACCLLLGFNKRCWFLARLRLPSVLVL